jgi:hypothetical protein
LIAIPGVVSSWSISHSFSLFKILPASGVGSADGDFIDNLLESIDKVSFCLALFVAHLIEEIKPIISVVSDRSGFGLINIINRPAMFVCLFVCLFGSVSV